MSGADNTGRFARHAKPLCWQVFLNIEEYVVRGIGKLGTTPYPTDECMKAIEKFVCQLYIPKTSLISVKGVRQAVLRAHYQAMVWANDVVANPIMPSPEEYGWEKEEDRWIPVMTCLLSAPEAIIELVKCGCKTKCASNRCQCRRAVLQCTDLCSCYVEDEPCENVHEVVDDDEGDN